MRPEQKPASDSRGRKDANLAPRRDGIMDPGTAECVLLHLFAGMADAFVSPWRYQ